MLSVQVTQPSTGAFIPSAKVEGKQTPSEYNQVAVVCNTDYYNKITAIYLVETKTGKVPEWRYLDYEAATLLRKTFDDSKGKERGFVVASRDTLQSVIDRQPPGVRETVQNRMDYWAETSITNPVRSSEVPLAIGNPTSKWCEQNLAGIDARTQKNLAMVKNRDAPWTSEERERDSEDWTWAGRLGSAVSDLIWPPEHTITIEDIPRLSITEHGEK